MNNKSESNLTEQEKRDIADGKLLRTFMLLIMGGFLLLVTPKLSLMYNIHLGKKCATEGKSIHQCYKDNDRNRSQIYMGWSYGQHELKKQRMLEKYGSSSS